MRRLILTITGVLILVSSGFCQVDTLMLVEINNFEIVDNITNLFIEDLNGDDIKELIICTNYFIYIYNSINNDLIWTSPTLVNPEDLMFEDINHDGLLDLSVKDSLNIYLFDPHNYNTIWTSPALDSTYKCYTIGDRNEDGWIDVAIVSKEPFTRFGDPDNCDTAWVDLYDGPLFEQDVGFFILMQNYTYESGYDTFRESPNRITIKKISGENGLEIKIFIFSDTYYRDNMGGDWNIYRYSGNVWLINDIDFYNFCLADIGEILFYDLLNLNENTYLHSLFDRYFICTTPWYASHYRIKYINSFSADTIQNSVVLWEKDYMADVYYWVLDWEGYVIGDIQDENLSTEIFFAYQDSLYLYGFSEGNLVWEIVHQNEIDSVKFIFKSPFLFESSQIICTPYDSYNEYQFVSGTDGFLTSILPDQGIQISGVTDLDNDCTDELLSIQDNSLHIYHLDYYVEIDNPTVLPYSTFIQPNYPNPFNTSTTIEFGLSMDAFVTIDIYDLLGRKVETIVSENQPAGLHKVTWNANDKPSGIYFYKIQAGEYTKTKKMLLLK